MKNKKDFRVSIFSEPLRWIHDQIELIGNSTLQIVGDIVRGTYTPMDELENPSVPKKDDRNKKEERPKEPECLSYEDTQKLRQKKKVEIEKLLKIRKVTPYKLEKLINVRTSKSKDKSHSR